MKQVKTAVLTTGLAWSLLGLPGISAEAADVGDALDRAREVTDKKEKNKDKGRVPDDVKKLVEKFQAERDAFLKAESDLRAKLKESTDDKRKALRDELKSLREKWTEKHRDLQEDIKERVKDLKVKLDDHKEIIDESKEKDRGGK